MKIREIARFREPLAVTLFFFRLRQQILTERERERVFCLDNKSFKVFCLDFINKGSGIVRANKALQHIKL